MSYPMQLFNHREFLKTAYDFHLYSEDINITTTDALDKK